MKIIINREDSRIIGYKYHYINNIDNSANNIVKIFARKKLVGETTSGSVWQLYMRYIHNIR